MTKLNTSGYIQPSDYGLENHPTMSKYSLFWLIVFRHDDGNGNGDSNPVCNVRLSQVREIYVHRLILIELASVAASD